MNNEYQSERGYKAGVSEWDSQSAADWKVGQQYLKNYNKMLEDTTYRPPSGGSTPSTYYPSEPFDPKAFARNAKIILGIIGVFAVVVAIKVGTDEYPKWHRDRLQQQLETAILEVSHDRVAEYSDFSKVSDWPTNIQEIYKRNQDVTLDVLLEKGPENMKEYRLNQKFEAGVQTWFRISAKGTEAYPYLVSIQEKPHKTMSPMLRAGTLSLYFLKDQCKKGIALGCTDAAKLRASLLFNGMLGYDEAVIVKMALNELPTEGPLAKDKSIAELREKLSRPLPDTGARHEVSVLRNNKDS